MNKFNDIFLKAKTVIQKSQKGYKVYTDKDNFNLVEATTAAEAIEKSGIKNPYKILPADYVTRSIFAQSELAELQKNQTDGQSGSPA